MKHVLLVILVILLALPLVALAAEDINWDAIIESGATADVAPVAEVPVQPVLAEDHSGFGWTDIVTKVIVWAIGAIGAVLSGLMVKVTNKYIKPWLRDIAVPWLEQRGLLDAAQTAVKYAEAELGRYTGDDKWNLALKTLQDQGYCVDSEAVIAALKSAWTDLNIAQITAGIKEADSGGENLIE